MTGYRISEVAERTGFTPATLRYYEELGIVPPAGRTDAGYRLYDDRAVARLSFVGRAKQLGLRLEQVGDLAELWDGDECGPVQRRMAAFVAAKLAETRARVAELTVLGDQLEAVAARLAAAPGEGPCNEACACNAEAGAPASAPVIACTLGPGLLGGRVAEWEAVVGRAVGRTSLDTGVRLRFAPEEGLAAALAALAEAEHGCCAFFDFAVGIRADEVTLDVRAPAEARPLLDQLFGTAS